MYCRTYVVSICAFVFVFTNCDRNDTNVENDEKMPMNIDANLNLLAFAP